MKQENELWNDHLVHLLFSDNHVDNAMLFQSLFLLIFIRLEKDFPSNFIT